MIFSLGKQYFRPMEVPFASSDASAATPRHCRVDFEHLTIQGTAQQLLRGRWNARLRALNAIIGARRWAGVTFKGERLINSRN